MHEGTWSDDKHSQTSETQLTEQMSNLARWGLREKAAIKKASAELAAAQLNEWNPINWVTRESYYGIVLWYVLPVRDID